MWFCLLSNWLRTFVYLHLLVSLHCPLQPTVSIITMLNLTTPCLFIEETIKSPILPMLPRSSPFLLYLLLLSMSNPTPSPYLTPLGATPVRRSVSGRNFIRLSSALANLIAQSMNGASDATTEFDILSFECGCGRHWPCHLFDDCQLYGLFFLLRTITGQLLWGFILFAYSAFLACRRNDLLRARRLPQ